MSRVVTIHQNTDFRRVYGRGKSCTSPALVVYCLKNRAGVGQFVGRAFVQRFIDFERREVRGA